MSPIVRVYNSPRFDIRDAEQSNEMLIYLQTHGYVVVANVCSENNVNEAKINFWDFMESVDLKKVNRNRPQTWTNKNWHADNFSGITYDLNHSKFLWDARLLPLVKQSFSAIHESDDLLVSFDTGNAFRPWQYEPTWITNSGWWHVDQNSLKGKTQQGRTCVQGLVTYYDATEETGGFCVIPGSHNQHDEICQRVNAKSDFVDLPEDDPLLTTCDSARLVLAKAGDLILWDSRVVHCNTHGLTSAAKEAWDIKQCNSSGQIVNTVQNTSSSRPELIRLCAYVCMQPRSLLSLYSRPNQVLKSRVDAFINRVSTNHLPLQIVPHSKQFCRDPVDITQCSPEQQALIGYPLKKFVSDAITKNKKNKRTVNKTKNKSVTVVKASRVVKPAPVVVTRKRK